MFNPAISLPRRKTTLGRRLVLLFLTVSVLLLMSFASLLVLFGITGDESASVKTHVDTELALISDRIDEDFGGMSVVGTGIAEDLSKRSDDFFAENGITPRELSEKPELIEPLLAEYMQTLVITAGNRYCGGVFVLLDTSVSKKSDTARAGVFLKKTQPTATNNVGGQIHYLRGPATLALENDMMLLGQWRMEYDISGEEFFDDVINTARSNPDLPLSRLYYWSGRTMLKDNSETGMLLCVPLKSSDGDVFGLCGIEVSDRLFKSCYTPKGSEFESIFTVLCPATDGGLITSLGLVAGNSYLTGMHPTTDLAGKSAKDDFVFYSGDGGEYGGKTRYLKMYPDDSAYSGEKWAVSILMPKDVLLHAAHGKQPYLLYIVVFLLVASLAGSIVISRRYLLPLNRAIHKIKDDNYGDESCTYAEIDDLFEVLSKRSRDYDDAIKQSEQELESLKNEYQKAQSEILKASYNRKTEVDPENYRYFLDSINTLTETEKIVFNHYLDGRTSKEIMEIMCIKESTLKYHNGNIYQKLGVTNRKELLRYALQMKEDNRTV